jgi:hypothetical protein
MTSDEEKRFGGALSSKFFDNRERVRGVLEHSAMMLQHAPVKTIAKELHLNTRTVARHIKAIVKEQP